MMKADQLLTCNTLTYSELSKCIKINLKYLNVLYLHIIHLFVLNDSV